MKYPCAALWFSANWDRVIVLKPMDVSESDESHFQA